jgi:hypothetical protein
MIMSPAGYGKKNDCAGEAHQIFNQPTDGKKQQVY